LAGADQEVLDAGPVSDRIKMTTITSMTNRPTSSKVLLVADGRSPHADPSVPVRRYRLARIVVGGDNGPSKSAKRKLS
jgi:hypothetical protein